MFAVENERDIIKVTTYHDQQWCMERGIHTGASGELNAHFGENERTGWYEQVIWGFKTTEQLAKEAAERAAAAEAKRQAMTPQEKTPEMEAIAQEKLAAAQADPEAGTDLPF